MILSKFSPLQLPSIHCVFPSTSDVLQLACRRKRILLASKLQEQFLSRRMEGGVGCMKTLPGVPLVILMYKIENSRHFAIDISVRERIQELII